jgi:hypothetical protein
MVCREKRAKKYQERHPGTLPDYLLLTMVFLDLKITSSRLHTVSSISSAFLLSLFD